MADRILVLEHGRIAEAGTGESLLAGGGTYSRLFNAGRYDVQPTVSLVAH